VNGTKKPKLAKCIYISLYINLNDIVNNATTKIELAVINKRK
jgi:hypothetical protein